MLLAADIGNSNIVFGVYDGEWKQVWRLDTKDEAQQLLQNSLEQNVGHANIDAIVVSSVVPIFTDVIKVQLETKYKIEAFCIDATSYDALPIDVIHPDKIGADLVCDALAASEKFNHDCMVVDFGTALTFTIVENKKILGVNITPGLKMAMHALSIDTAKLHEIKLELPKSVIGKDTTTAIQSGILWGYVGLVERMIDRVEEELGKKLKIVATGGLSKVLEPLHERFDDVDPNLTIEGMRLIYKYNRQA